MTQTILLTGVSGFIAKRIAYDLLEAGYSVRGSLRSMARAVEVRAAMKGHRHLDRLDFVELDLGSDAGWDDAMLGVDALMHTASPFPMASPKNEDDLIRPAVDGTLRALNAAQKAGVTRVVLTASVVSIIHSDRPKGHKYGPADWTDLTHASTSAYGRSKTLAEKAAWDFVVKHPEMQLTTIHPGLVLGTPMDRHYGTSLNIIERMMSGKDPMVPNIGMSIVDVNDVSALHVAALTTAASIGQRVIANDDYWMMTRMAKVLRTAHPDRKIATKQAPRFLLKLLSLFDPAIKSVLPLLDREVIVDNSATVETFKYRFIPAQQAIENSAAFVADKSG